jgi:hypothetical protein
MQMLDFVRANRLPFGWRDVPPEQTNRPRSVPGGARTSHREASCCARGVGRELAPREEVDLLVVGAGPLAAGRRL